jgi:hypothetical protein
MSELLAPAQMDIVRGEVGGQVAGSAWPGRIEPQFGILPEIGQLERSTPGGEEVQHDAIAE